MKKYRLGKTELMVSELGFGGIPIARVSEEKAIKTIKRAVELGINFIDTANAYGDSEYKIGKAIKGIRDDVIIATKSSRRDKNILLSHIDNSLKLFQTDHIDLFQIHNVSKDSEYDAVFASGGALEGALEAQKSGKILHIGITSHRLELAEKLVKTGHFSTIQFPANFIEVDSLKTLFPEAIKREMGCIIMKPLGGGTFTDPKICFKFLQQYPELIPIPGMSEIKEVEENIALYEKKLTLTKEDWNTIEALKIELGKNFCRRCGYCEPCPQGVNVFIGMSLKRIALNYGKQFKAPWFINSAETLDKCIECGICEARCPYNLPIIETIKANKKFYDEEIKN